MNFSGLKLQVAPLKRKIFSYHKSKQLEFFSFLLHLIYTFLWKLLSFCYWKHLFGHIFVVLQFTHNFKRVIFGCFKFFCPFVHIEVLFVSIGKQCPEHITGIMPGHDFSWEIKNVYVCLQVHKKLLCFMRKQTAWLMWGRYKQ